MANEGNESMLYKSMLNKTLGLSDFNQYSYLFEDENGDDTESLLNTPSSDAEMSSTVAEMSSSAAEEVTSQIDDSRPAESSTEALPNNEPNGFEQITRRNQQLQNYWKNQQKESQLIENKLSSIRVRVEQNETQWKKEKTRLLSPQSRIPKPKRSSVSALDLQLEAEREKRMELEVQCSALNQQLQELQKDKESKTLASLRVETLKQMQKRHAEEIRELHEQAEHAREKHAMQIVDFEAVLLKCQQHGNVLEGEKATLESTQGELRNEIERLQGVLVQQKGEISTLEEKLQDQNAIRERTENDYSALEQKFKRQTCDIASLREIVSRKEEDKATIKASLATTETEKVKLQHAFALLECQKLGAEQEIKKLKVELHEARAITAEESSSEIETCRRQVAEWNEKYEQEYDKNVKLEKKLKRFEALGESNDCLESKRQKKEPNGQDISTKAHYPELQILQLQENHQVETNKLKAEIEVYRSQVADLNLKYKELYTEHLKLHTKLGHEDTNGQIMINQDMDNGSMESVSQKDSEGRTSLNSKAMRKHTKPALSSNRSTSFNASLHNHVTQIETEHAQEIQELLHGLGQEQSGAFDWSSQFESRIESQDAFSTPFKVKSNTTDGNISGSVLSPILRSEQSDIASTGSDNMERKIDGLMEEIGLLDQERVELLGGIQQEVSYSKNCGHQEESELIEDVTAISEDAQSTVSKSQNHHTEQPSNDVLDGTILLLNNLKDLMDGQEDENEKEASVLDQLEALSEMMNDETHIHSGLLNDSRSDKRSDASAMRASVHPRVSRIDPSILHHDGGEPLKDVWRVLVAELRHRISFLEHDRNEVVRITGEMLERERDADRLKLQSAISSARREAYEDIQTILLGNA